MKIEKCLPVEEACAELGGFNMSFHTEDLFPLDVVKGMASTIATVDLGMSWLVRGDDGLIVGSIGLHAGTDYYSSEKYLSNQWLNVRDGEGHGRILRMLLALAVKEAVDRDMALILWRSPHRSKLHSEFGHVAEAVGFVPYGHARLFRAKPSGGG